MKKHILCIVIFQSIIQGLFGQSCTKIYGQYINYFAKPIQINDSIFMIGLNLQVTDAAISTIDTNGNIAAFKHIYRSGFKDSSSIKISHIHKDKLGNIYVFGTMGIHDVNTIIGFLLKLDINGNKLSLKYYRGKGGYFRFEEIVYDTVSNTFFATGNVDEDYQGKNFSFIMQLDSNGSTTNYSTFKETYDFIHIKREWNALILSGTHWEPIDSVFEESAPVIRYLRLDNLESKWKHPVYYDETNGIFGFNVYSTTTGNIYFNANVKKNTNGFGNNQHIIELDTNGHIVSFIPTCSKDSFKEIDNGYQYNDSINIEVGEFSKPPYANWDWKFMLRKASLSGKVYNEWIWDSNLNNYDPCILKTSNNTSLVSLRLNPFGFTPLVLMKFDSDLKRIPFDEGAKPMEYLPNIKKGDTLSIDGGTDTIYLYNKTSIWEGSSDVEKIKNVYHIFPNPTNALLYINGLPPQKINITLYDMLGKKVFNTVTNGEKLYSINVEHLPKGLYIILVGNVSQKVVVE
ncbi:MAG: T9SS type A sorting domain-containing protein [Bacteroidota bacterium]|nr:T9SS type A sorting domain-containing protein [Bacteroidota bacterium]